MLYNDAYQNFIIMLIRKVTICMETVNDGIMDVINKYPREQRYSLAILQDLQHKYNYIPREGMESLADYLGCPLSALYSMATFYKALSLRPKGRHIIKLCDGTACHVRGSASLRDGIARVLGIQDGEATEDGMFSLELVNCLGSCALAPAMLIDEDYHGNVTAEKLPGIFNAYRKEEAAK